MLLGSGRNRSVYYVVLAVIGVIALITLYNPSVGESTPAYWKSVSDYAKNPKPPQWISGKSTDTQSTIPNSPLSDNSLAETEAKLPSKNPEPYPYGGTTSDKNSNTDSNSNSQPGAASGNTNSQPAEKPEDKKPAEKPVEAPKAPPDGMGTPPPDKELKNTPAFTHSQILAEYHEVRSVSTPDGKHFNITFPGYITMNPNILAHPRDPGTWVVTAQHYPRERNFTSGWCAELSCDAKFEPGGNLTCVTPPMFAIVPSTTSPGFCKGDIANINLNVGPHDARVFYGPEFPYIIYGSQSHHTCFGQWVQDFRLTVDWGLFWNPEDPFSFQTEIQRPGKYGVMEKNYFIFWGMDNKTIYAHYDSSPKRSFAKLNMDGSAGEDLAPQAYAKDEVCWQKHLTMNPLPTEKETGWKSSVHQASNALSVTMCKRSDPDCKRLDSNTYVIQIYQHKIGNGFMHARYEPYVMMFQQVPPFAMHAISAKPIWIHGRKDKESMIYVTSINWKPHDSKYHGFLDDELFINFGIEDSRTAGIDVTAEALLVDNLMEC